MLIQKKCSMTLEIDFVIETCLVALYSRDIFSNNIFLKGGQALRLKENLRGRFSADIDFSTRTRTEDEDVFFDEMKSALAQEFFRHDLCLFDFKFVRRPKKRADNTPDSWSGWAVEFKLIEESKRNLNPTARSVQALIPKGDSSPIIEIDISEYEYCDGVEKMKVKGTLVGVYSRTLLLLEKIRAICQQHPEYPLKGEGQRARDYYDVERLWNLVLKSGSTEHFLKDCAQHISNVFAAKKVELDLLKKIFEPGFVQLQSADWASVKGTVNERLQPFEYYNESLSVLISEILARLKSG